MRKHSGSTIKVIFFILVVSLFLCENTFPFIASSLDGSTLVSKVDLRRYFEKAMNLFESGQYKDAIVVFENLIEIEKSQGDIYFTPFAEIYIEKSNARMRDMIVLEDRRWEKMKKDVISEAERIALQEVEKKKEIQRHRGEFIEESKEVATYDLSEEADALYREALRYYNEGNYPQAIVKFKRIKELDVSGRLVLRVESFIERAQRQIGRREEKELLIKMQTARRARLEMEKDQRRQQIELVRREKEKEKLKKAFEYKMLRQKIAKIEEVMSTVRRYVSEKRFEDAEGMLNEAIAEFPENKKFKDILRYVEMQKVKLEEEAFKRAREITEEKMLLEVAQRHILPEEKFGTLEKKKITPIVHVPEIRKRLKIPISVDFKEVDLDYVLNFLSDATGINIVSSKEIDMSERKVTIKIKDMPLEEALGYILKSQKLVYRIEQDAVWVATKEELENEKIETRIYFLDQGVGRFAEFVGIAGEEGVSTSTEVKTLKDTLENVVEWPKDSKLTMDARTGALIISNIPSNLEIIENLLYTLDVTPIQVLIEARFLEVKVTDVDELGIEWKLNSAWGTTQNNAKQNIHGFAANSGVDFSSFSRSDEGFNLTYQGILSHPQFQMVIHALNEKEDVKTLSAPRITTLNNQTATIEVIDEYIYPTRYEVSLVQYDINGDGDFNDAGESEWANIPQDFVTRDVGILLHVKPSVGVDNKTITLALTPEVSEQDSTTPSYSYSGSVSIPNFKTRNLSTSVIIESDQTVVLGGLIKETNTNVKTKVPLLGDLPFVGALFRKSTDSVERRNLLIFVTARVLNRDGDIVASASQDGGIE